MKTIVTIIMLAFAMSVSAADAPKKATDKKAAVKKEKCVPSKEVVCQDSLKGKTRPTPKKVETPK